MASLLREWEVVWARQKGYPYWPAVLSPAPDPPNLGFWQSGKGKKIKYHCTFLAWNKERAWLEGAQVKEFKREDGEPGRKKEYLVKRKEFKESHLEAIRLALEILDDPDNPLDHLVTVKMDELVAAEEENNIVLEGHSNEDDHPKEKAVAKPMVGKSIEDLDCAMRPETIVKQLKKSYCNRNGLDRDKIAFQLVGSTSLEKTGIVLREEQTVQEFKGRKVVVGSVEQGTETQVSDGAENMVEVEINDNIVATEESDAPASENFESKKRKFRLTAKKDKKLKTEKSDMCISGKEICEGEENEDLTESDLQYIAEINQFMKEIKLDLEAKPATIGDGNCWYRAAASQVVLHDIPNKPRDHRAMRQEVCNYLKHLPRQVKEDTVHVVYKGKDRGLTDLASRQRKPGQWVDNTGVMVMATAHFLGRNISLYGYPKSQSRKFSITEIEGGDQADEHPPLTVFYHGVHYQTLQPADGHSQEQPD